jgi:hypothetical protein
MALANHLLLPCAGFATQVEALWAQAIHSR